MTKVMSYPRLFSVVMTLSLSFSSLSAQAAERLLTIGGAVTEIVYALGKGDEIIANDITSYYPEAANKVPKVGYMRTLSAEGLLSMRPTLIIADAGAGPLNVLEQIRSAGVKVIQLQEGFTPEHVATNIRLIGKQLQAANTEKVAAQYEDAWQETAAKVAALKNNPRVLFVLDHTGKNPQAAGDETAANAIIKLIHADNVMMKQFKGYKPLTAESMVAAAPEVIITTYEGVQASGGLEVFLDKPGLRMTPAGKAKRVISLDSLLLLGFTPRLPNLVADLSKAVRQP
ncbi:MAG TPA: ABC transporter substrate-binding protein [Methylophilaceae bacterium]|nr:ABC transporter substrate-binding protein [Methylophilaceae bacterium]